MYQPVYFTEKRTGTFADVLAAYGLAAILDEILAQALGRETRRRVWIRDAGPYYKVELPEPMRKSWVDNCRPFTLVPFVKRQGIEPSTEMPDKWIRDLDAERQDYQTFQSLRSRQGCTNNTEIDADIARQIADLTPASNYRVLECIGDWKMQATGRTRNGFQSYNAIAYLWQQTLSHFDVNIRFILRMCASLDANPDVLAREWAREMGLSSTQAIVTASQLLNPVQGQGQNHPKANRLDTRKNVDSFWLFEYLKAAGMWICAAPRKVAPAKAQPTRQHWERADRKTYVLAPLNITLAAHQAVFETFSARLWNETAVKMDCIATLLYTDTLLEHSEAGQYDELDFEGYGPENVVAGFHVAQYKLLSRNAYTAINLAFLGLPIWTDKVRSRQEVLDLRKVIHEHREVIDSIDEGRSDGYNLLLRYRDFLSGQRWNDFFEFAVGYSHYAMSRMAHGQLWVPLFTTTSLRRLIMATKKPLSAIVENPGFQNVAYAIRHSTLIPQDRKARGQDTLYDIRYGLGMDLKRKATVRDDFIAALADFMQNYNQENSQVLEKRKQQKRRDLRTIDVEEVLRLVDDYGPELVANLLVAYGYAREPREENETGELTTQTSTKS